MKQPTQLERRVLRDFERGVITTFSAATRALITPEKKVTRGGAAYRLLMVHIYQARRARR